MTARIVVVGSLNMDLVIQAPHLPVRGETVLGGSFSTIPGGKGANQAVAAARMGGQVSMVGCVGSDDFGDTLIAGLEQDRVNTQRIERSDAATGVALITVGESGENTIVLAPGANYRVDPELVDRNADAIATADALLLQLEVPLPAVIRAVEIARRHNVPVILNPAPAQSLPPELLNGITYLIPNESETAALTGMDIDSTEDASEAAQGLRALGVGNVILTLGEHGTMVLLPKEAIHIPAFAVKVVDTTAAGDAFVGAFSVALSEGKPLAEAARWGNAAGALACTVLGAQPSLPTRSAVEALLQAQPARS